MTSDFATVTYPSPTGGSDDFDAGTKIPFPTAGNPNPAGPGTTITVTAAGNIQIANTGWYQLSWGLCVTNSSDVIVQIVASTNGGVSFIPIPMGSITNGVSMGMTGVGGSDLWQSQTTLVHITTNPTQLAVQVASGMLSLAYAGAQVADAAPLVYVTLIKISN
jgi:hypothetical protein